MAKFLDPAGRTLRDATKEMKSFTCEFILFPEKWSTYPNRVANLQWKRIKFDGSIRANLPKDQFGIYSFVLEPGIASHSAVGYLLYVGKAERQSLRSRCSAYLNEPNNPKGRP